MMKRNAQLPEKCPIMAGFYFIKDFEVDPEILPPYTPDAQFLANVLLYSKFNGSKPALLGIIIHEGMFRRKRKTGTLPFPKFESARIRN
ncbi:unnamed protein product [Hermetia illucens]|uniref:Uncharacterized protein n=2 Tax=Hermetia illucens TaxID=343691 RepID=A0A7R8YQA7_HERIL|nr:unnamed protein product [Hermetia illucens]